MILYHNGFWQVNAASHIEKLPMFRLSLLLIASLLTAVTIDAQVLSGRDAYIVRTSERTLSNSTRLPASALVVTRPEAGTYAQGMIVVKTRATHGVLREDKALGTSPLNIALASIDVAAITSTFPETANAENAALASEIGLDRMYTIRYNDGMDPFDVCKRLMESPDVEYAVPMEIFKPNFIPNDPDYATKQPWLKTLKMEEAWEVSKGSKDVLIAIIDSGTDWSHEDLAAQIFNNTAEVPNNGVDDDKNGFVDDIRGWDFVGNVSLQDVQYGVLKPDNDPKVSYPTINQVNGHGTIVAGCAAAQTNNAKGIASPAFNCSILPIKVGSDNPNIGGLLAGYEAIKYAADMGADVINCSWGGTTANPQGQDIINYARAKGAVVVCASGNSGLFTETTPHYPSSFDGVLSVGSSNNSDQASDFSNYGYDVTTYAPGEDIYSTFPGNKYQASTGTSFSCPLVAGICALIKAKHPDWTPDMIIQQIRSTSDALNGVPSANRPLYFGRANANTAIRYNNSFSSGDRVPGIAVSSVQVGGIGLITSYDPTTVSIDLKNLLGDATNVNISVTNIGTGVLLASGSQAAIPVMLHDDSARMELVVQLQPLFPWYETSLKLLVTITSGAYLNYAIVKVPVKLPSKNTHDYAGPNEYMTYDLVDLTSDGTLWVTARFFGQNALITGSAVGSSTLVTSPLLPTAIRALSSKNVLVGGLDANKATIAYTRNAQSWTKVDVSSSMATVAGICMFDATNGVSVGNPVGGKLGIARTTDGGATWFKATNALAANSGETVIPGTACNTSNGIWFATSSRRIVYSKDKGATWSSTVFLVNNASITSLAMADDENGALLYKFGGKTLVASSRNNGPWTANTFDPTTLGITAVALASPGKHLVMVGSNSEVFGSDDAGANWQVILSKPAGVTARAVARTSTTSVLATVGEGIGILSYRYSGPNGTRILSAATDSVDFGTVASGQNRLRTVQLTSTGESTVAIDSVVVKPLGGTPPDAFVLTRVPELIDPGTSENVSVRIYATDTGAYNATIHVYSNAQGDPIQVHLSAVVRAATSVAEQDVLTSIALYPNPAESEAHLQLPTPAHVSVVDVVGATVYVAGYVQAGTTMLSIRDLPQGAYRVVIEGDAYRATLPLVIAR